MSTPPRGRSVVVRTPVDLRAALVDMTIDSIEILYGHWSLPLMVDADRRERPVTIRPKK